MKQIIPSSTFTSPPVTPTNKQYKPQKGKTSPRKSQPIKEKCKFKKLFSPLLIHCWKEEGGHLTAGMPSQDAGRHGLCMNGVNGKDQDTADWTVSLRTVNSIISKSSSRCLKV